MKTFKYIFAAGIIAFMFTGCKYDFIVPEELPDPGEQVSFSEDIVPIFESKCTACHDTGGQMPDLTAANAFSSINRSRYINEDNPGESLIYSKPVGSHPAQYTEREAALVLEWINQGAENN